MRKYLWIIIVIILAVALLAGIALMRRPEASIDRASSPNGETEIIPDDPNEPWRDLSADDSSGAASDDSSEQGTVSLPAASGTPAAGGATSSDNTTASSSGTSASSGDSNTSAGPSSGNGASSDSSASSEPSSPAGDSDISGSNPDSSVPSVPSVPDSGSDDNDSDLVVSADGMHEYELPYVPLS